MSVFRRTRPSHRRNDRNYVGGPKAYRRAPVTTVSATEIIKECWPKHSLSGGPVMERSWAAKLARERHWISWSQYFAMPLQDTGRVARGLANLVYAESPLFAMLKRDTTFAPLETAES